MWDSPAGNTPIQSVPLKTSHDSTVLNLRFPPPKNGRNINPHSTLL